MGVPTFLGKQDRLSSASRRRPGHFQRPGAGRAPGSGGAAAEAATNLTCYYFCHISYSLNSVKGVM